MLGPHFVRSGRPDVAVIGAGLMGRWHATNARRLGARVVAIVDIDPRRAQLVARRHRAAVFASIDAMLAKIQPDAAHVCTPLETHVEYSKRLLSAGCDVVCEKPLAASSEEVAELLRHARNAGGQLCPVHQFAVQRGVARTVERLRDLGDIRRVAFAFCSAGGEDKSSSAYDEVLLDILPHPLSILAKIRPNPTLATISWQGLHTAPGELQVSGAWGDVPVSIFVSLSARPTEASASIVGTRATANIDFFHGFAVTNPGPVSRFHKAARPFAAASRQLASATVNLATRAARMETAYPGLRALLSEFYRSMANSAAPPFADAEIIEVYRARDAIARLLRRLPRKAAPTPAPLAH